jgi:uncharacterized membrane protein YjjP (DUF1212 family)
MATMPTMQTTTKIDKLKESTAFNKNPNLSSSKLSAAGLAMVQSGNANTKK